MSEAQTNGTAPFSADLAAVLTASASAVESPVQEALRLGWESGTADVPPRSRTVELAVVDSSHKWADRVPLRDPSQRYVFVCVKPGGRWAAPWAGFSLLRMPPGHEHEADEVHYKARRLGLAFAASLAPPSDA